MKRRTTMALAEKTNQHLNTNINSNKEILDEYEIKKPQFAKTMDKDTLN